jgi:hypothetical protein
VPKSPGISRIKSAVTLRKTGGSVSNKWLLQCGKVPILIFNAILTSTMTATCFKFWAALALCGLATTPASARFFTLGTGLMSCPEWVKAQPDLGASLINHAWIQGFLTAYSALQEDGDIRENLTAEQVFPWVDRYRAAHPLAKVAHATFALIYELEDRKKLPHVLGTLTLK